ncbi:hypothetical protein B4U80_13241 [Leptotrombidium deliense]|uniref:F-box domain-containing protein n=1 Tax=Leptotrombidium deliense TaxID=299467 RepID=A0A443SA65_9ACAR|nr:hypothetical protein B4U80_13241 [Leptotrombidium deliense]
MDLGSLFLCRCVSQEWKQNVNLVLSHQCKWLELSRSEGRYTHFSKGTRYAERERQKEVLQRMTTVCSMYSKTEKVSINSYKQSMLINVSKVLKICRENMKQVKHLTINDVGFHKSYFTLIAFTFPHLTSISLCRAQVDNDVIRKTFASLQCLRQVYIESLPLSGPCFSEVADRIEKIEWTLANIDALIGFPLAIKLRSLRLNFDFVMGNKNDLFQIITENMPNLEKLAIGGEGLQNYHSLKLRNLKCLVYELWDVYDTPDVYSLKDMPTVEKLKVTVNTLYSFPFAILLPKLPFVSKIFIHSASLYPYTYPRFSVLSVHLILALNAVRTLKFFRLHERVNAVQQYVRNIGRVAFNMLHYLFTSIDFVDKIQIHITSENIYGLLAITDFKQQRIEQTFCLQINDLKF